MTSTAFKESIHILGAGSIGCLFASSIRAKFPNYPVTLLLRTERRKQLGRNATAIDILWKTHPSHAHLGDKSISVPVEFLKDESEVDSKLPPIRNLVVTTKAYQALPAIQSVIPRLQSNVTSSTDESHDNHSFPRIILLCNGALAVKEELQSYFEKSATATSQTVPQVVLATTTHGAYRERDIDQDITKHSTQQSFFHAGYGQTFIENSAQEIAKLWNDAGLNCSALSAEAMNALLWKKLAVNCVINPLTAIYGCTNGELLLEPSFFELQQELLEEVAQVAAGAAADEGADDSNSSPSVDELRQFVQQVIQDTHANKSSMYQDIANGQRTEIDHLNGYIVRKGRTLQMECPANEDICQRIQELQQSNEKSSRV